MKSSASLYSDLSHYYDRFCADIDYPMHCDFVERASACFANSGTRQYLDLACGTGQLLGLMADRCYEVTGLDNSEDMLAGAALRCPSATLIKDDIAAFDLPDSFDIVTCFLYSIHYSYPLNSMKQTLVKVFRALKEGGVFIFDLVDKKGIGERDVVSRLDEQDGTCLTFRSGWRYPGQGEKLELHLSIGCDDGLTNRVWHDQHTMTATTIEEVRQAMLDVGFEVIVLEHDFSTLREWGGETFNAILVGCKPTASSVGL